MWLYVLKLCYTNTLELVCNSYLETFLTLGTFKKLERKNRANISWKYIRQWYEETEITGWVQCFKLLFTFTKIFFTFVRISPLYRLLSITAVEIYWCVFVNYLLKTFFVEIILKKISIWAKMPLEINWLISTKKWG